MALVEKWHINALEQQKQQFDLLANQIMRGLLPVKNTIPKAPLVTATSGTSYLEDEAPREAQTNAIGFTRRCYYCGSQGHFPDNCRDCRLDTNHGLVKYNSDIGLVKIGPEERILPPQPVGRFIAKGSSIRRFVFLWILHFDRSLEIQILDKVLKKSGQQRSDWVANDIEENILQEFFNRESSMEYWLPDAKETSPSPVATNSIQIDNTPLDQMDAAEVNTIEAVNAVKRRRVDEPEDADDSARHTSRENRQENIPPPSEKQAAKTKEPVEKVTMEEQKERVRRKIVSDVMARKVGIAMSDLLLLDSPIGNAIAGECRDLVDGVENTLWEEGRGPVLDVDASINANPIVLETKEGRDRALEMYQRAAEECGFSVSTIRLDEKGTARPFDRRINLVSVEGRTPAPSQELPKLMIKLGNPESRPVEAMVDTGSEVNIIEASLAEKFQLKVEGARVKTKSYSHDEVYLEGTTTVNLYVGNVWIKQQVYVVNTSVTQPFILGMPFVRSARVSFEYSPDGQMVLSCLLGTTRVRSPVAGSMKWSADTTWESLKTGLSKPTRTTAITIDHACQPKDGQSGEEPDKHPILMLEGLDPSDQVVPLNNDEGTMLLSEIAVAVAQEQRWAALRRMREHGSEQHPFLVNTLYKRKGVKVHPRDDIPSDGTVPEGSANWKEAKWPEVQGLMDTSTPFSDLITPKFSLIEKGTRIYGERLQGLLDQVKEELTKEELALFLQIMYNREAALSWDFEESGTVDPSIAPPQVIKVIEHKA